MISGYFSSEFNGSIFITIDWKYLSEGFWNMFWYILHQKCQYLLLSDLAFSLPSRPSAKKRLLYVTILCAAQNTPCVPIICSRAVS